MIADLQVDFLGLLDVLPDLDIAPRRKLTKARRDGLETLTVKPFLLKIQKEEGILERIVSVGNKLEPGLRGPPEGEDCTEYQDNGGRLTTLCGKIESIFGRDSEEGVGHSKLAYSLAYSVACKFGIPVEHAKVIALGAFLHDIGKANDILPRAPVSGTTLVDALENGTYFDRPLFEMTKLHAPIGCLAVLSATENIPELKALAPLVLFSHEDSDALGYYGLKGDEIPIGSMIISVADSFLAIYRPRSYDSGTSYVAAVLEILRCTGLNYEESASKIKEILLGRYDLKPNELPEPASLSEPVRELLKYNSSGLDEGAVLLRRILGYTVDDNELPNGLRYLSKYRGLKPEEVVERTLRRYNVEKVAGSLSRCIETYGPELGTYYHKDRLKKMIDRNTRWGRRIHPDIKLAHGQVMASNDLELIQNAYLDLRLLPERQFYAPIVNTFLEIVLMHPKVLENNGKGNSH